MPTLTLGGNARVLDVVFMDCDGVIFDSNAQKARAFIDSLPGYPEEARQALAAYHREHGGMSRYEKFRHFFREIHPVDNVEPAMQDALRRFGELSERGYEDLAPREEALSFAERMGAVYVVSGADQTELRRIFDDKGLSARFADVLGSPTPKLEHMQAVLEACGSDGTRAVMVGDGRSDFEAARSLHMPFIFLREMSRWSSADDALRGAPECYVAESWTELLSWS
jgi:phosphoglycolate phosphatase-like HAD superfamily hydrolase